VYRLTANNTTESVLVKKQKGWVTWVSVKFWMYLVHLIVLVLQEIFWKDINYY